MQLTSPLLLVLFPILVFGQNEGSAEGSADEPSTDGIGSGNGGWGSFPKFPDFPKFPEFPMLPGFPGFSDPTIGEDSGEHSLMIFGSTIHGDLIVDGSTGHRVHITDITILGNLVFVNGCEINDDMIHECDGSKRKMQKNERIKLRERIAHLRKHQKAQVGGKKVEGHKNGPHHLAKRHNRLAHGHSKSKAHARHNHAAHVPGDFSPCSKCPSNEGSGEASGKETAPEVASGAYEGSGSGNYGSF